MVIMPLLTRHVLPSNYYFKNLKLRPDSLRSYHRVDSNSQDLNFIVSLIWGSIDTAWRPTHSQALHFRHRFLLACVLHSVLKKGWG
jgi:hypothetical protein